MNQLLDPKNTTGKLNVSKFPIDSKQSYSLDVKNVWVKSLLLELNENAETKLPEEYLEDSFLKVDLHIEKKYQSTYGEYLIVTGNLSTEFITQCTRTLTEMKDSLQAEFKICFLDNAYEKSDELADEVDIFMDNEVHELYFYVNRIADIKEMVHEQIFLNINLYPVSDYDAELGWTKETTETKQ